MKLAAFADIYLLRQHIQPRVLALKEDFAVIQLGEAASCASNHSRRIA